MVFSSIPSYIDPSNWQQQQNHQIIGSSSANPLLQPPPPHAALPPQPYGIGGGTGAIRPGSMAERAHMANIPMPEAALKCPRCDSTNTKFCYFNNYSLSQPRHFCKTCRRYWTRGGALRNVPVGGGCRRNKRSKSSTSKSRPSSDRQTNPSSTSATSTNSGNTASLLGLGPQFPPLRFMSPFGQLTDSFTGDMGLNYSGIAAPPVGTNETNLHGANNLFGMASFLSSEGGGGGIEPWRLQQVHQQFPFLGGGLDTQSAAGIYQFHHGGESGFGESSHQVRPKLSSSVVTQMAAVKMEDNGEKQNLSRQLLRGGMTGNNEQLSGPTSWTDLSSFSTSSTNNNPL